MRVEAACKEVIGRLSAQKEDAKAPNQIKNE
jgi:hypothetical protein